jgi:hypothetical protein
MPRKKKSTLDKLKKAGKGLKKNAKDVKAAAGAVSKDSKTIYKKAKNGRYYKLVNGRPRFVSNKEATS